MKKLSLMLSLVSILAAGQAQAALTGNVTIQGTVAAATAITVTSVTGYNSLDLSSSQTNLLVANIREVNNTAAGYSVTLTSSNAGSLKNGSIGSLAYTATYDDVAVTLSSTPQTVTTGGASTAVVNTVKPFKISYTGTAAENLMQGSYSDTLTFTIAAN